VRSLLLALGALLGLLGLLFVLQYGLRVPNRSISLAMLFLVVGMECWLIYRRATTPITTILAAGIVIWILMTVGGGLAALGPIGTISLIAALVVAAVIGQWYRYRNQPCRPDTPICMVCGHDLRDVHDHCPACDTPIPKDLERRRRIRTQLVAKRNRQ